jgi:hypothetical protein
MNVLPTLTVNVKGKFTLEQATKAERELEI